ncbi:DMT family transporter [Caulobacter sp. RL271]|jgi:drug/metabolite transporter (DMT)-like permease|uniref:DMT family transporter n=1 Tax=Caulobacter segnis TaxID=88688 RepID=A0ABY4ZQI9_9CAUL|nr:DMT family transporter [Caulobacter segnis]USQ95063.1 DMT family transporter [Caulobacter segnis]
MSFSRRILLTSAPTNLYQDRRFVVGMAVLCCLLWGSAFPAVKVGYALLHVAKTDTASQMLFAGWRFLAAGLILLALAVLTRKPLAVARDQVGQVIGLGVFQTTLQYVFFYIGLAHATGVKSSIMNATGAFFGVILAHFLFKDDRLTPRKVAGCLLGFAGVLAVNLGGKGLDFEFSLLGEGFVVAAAFVLAAASIWGKSISRKVDPLVMTGWQLSLGGAGLLAIGFGLGGHLGGFDARSLALLAYMAGLSAAAFALWSLLIKHNPVGMLAVFNFLIPVFGVLLSAVFLHEPVLAWKNAAALALVCAGIWLVTRKPA